MGQTKALFGAVVVLSGFAACAKQDEGQPVLHQDVAALGSTGTTETVVFTASENASKVSQILAGATPKDFHWISVTIPLASDPRARSQDGLSVDLTDTTTGVVFRQVYQDVCNPALKDFQPCWLFESYEAGIQGLSGNLVIGLTDTNATGVWDLTWEGLTDRFGPPEQWHRHGSSAGIAGPFIPEASR